MVPVAVEAGDAIAAFLSSWRLAVLAESFGLLGRLSSEVAVSGHGSSTETETACGIVLVEFRERGALIILIASVTATYAFHRYASGSSDPCAPGTLRAPFLPEAARVQAWREASDLELSDARGPFRALG